MAKEREKGQHGSDICECGDFRSQHSESKRLCANCGCLAFRFFRTADDRDLGIWNKYHLPKGTNSQ